MGKTLIIIAAILGLASIFLGLILPSIFPWFRIEEVLGGTMVLDLYLNGIGMVEGYDIDIFVLSGGICVILGAILGIAGGAKESKGVGILGGVLMLVGPVLLIFYLFIDAESFRTILHGLGVSSGANLFWGTVTIGGSTITWGVWIGWFLGIGAGALGIIGGATV
ncbi:MAG: hypothetical protein ACFFCV_22110 [Promethearchaeota archaeon]